jgi:hypothetical protein
MTWLQQLGELAPLQVVLRIVLTIAALGVLVFLIQVVTKSLEGGE